MPFKPFSFSIINKIYIMLSISVLAFLIISTQGYLFTKNNDTALKHIKNIQLPLSIMHSNNLNYFEEMVTMFNDTASTGELDILEQINQKQNLIKENLHKAAFLSKQKYLKNLSLLDNYYKTAIKFVTSIHNNPNQIDIKLIHELQSISNVNLKKFIALKTNASHNLLLALKHISNTTSNFFSQLIIISILGICIILFFGIYINHNIKKRLRYIITSIKNLVLKNPDFTRQLKVRRNDEMGELLTWFNKLQKKLEIDYNKLNSSLQQEIEETQKEVIFTMGAIGERRSQETGNHVKRVALYSRLFAIKYGLKESEADLLYQVSPMHDIGKIAIPDNILNKPGSFNEEEYEIMKTHVILGYEMLKNSNKTLLKAAAVVAYEHHEKWNGSGYPNQTKGEDIHIYGRITALADVFDALGSDRVYKKAWSDERIFDLFKEQKGIHFEPKLVDIFFDNLQEFLDIRNSLRDDV